MLNMVLYTVGMFLSATLYTGYIPLTRYQTRNQPNQNICIKFSIPSCAIHSVGSASFLTS